MLTIDTFVKLSENDLMIIKKFVVTKIMKKLCNQTKQYKIGTKDQTIKYFVAKSYTLLGGSQNFIYFIGYKGYYYSAPPKEFFEADAVILNGESIDTYECTILIKYLLQNHYTLFESYYNDMNNQIQKSKKRKQAAKERGKLKTASTFNQKDQIFIALSFYRLFMKGELPDVVNKFQKLFGCSGVKISFPEIRDVEKHSLLTSLLYGGQYLATDLTGQSFYDSIINETKIDIESVFEQWINSQHETLRRFAIKFSKNPELGLFDKSERIRTMSKIELNNSK